MSTIQNPWLETGFRPIPFLQYSYPFTSKVFTPRIESEKRRTRKRKKRKSIKRRTRSKMVWNVGITVVKSGRDPPSTKIDDVH